MEGVDNHRAEDLFKLFRKHFGETQNWPPETIQRKLVVKSNNVWKSKQKSLRGTDCLLEENSFQSALKNGTNFIAVVETKNISARDSENDYELARFLTQLYDGQFIWVVGRARRNPNKFDRLDYCNTFIEIPDLNFGANRKNQIGALCPITDILMILLLEDNYKVSILFDKEYLKLRYHRSKWYIQPVSKKSNFWKTKNRSNEKENEDPNQPGPSGLSSQRSGSSGSAKRSRSRDSHFETTDLSSQMQGSSSSQCETVPSQSQLDPNENVSADEGDMKFDETREIVYKRDYAEVTSCGITAKIEIASKEDYPDIVSKVGFQIDTFSLF